MEALIEDIRNTGSQGQDVLPPEGTLQQAAK